MALPVTELYALFLERRPEEKERVEQARLLEAKVGVEPSKIGTNVEDQPREERDVYLTVKSTQALNGQASNTTKGVAIRSISRKKGKNRASREKFRAQKWDNGNFRPTTLSTWKQTTTRRK